MFKRLVVFHLCICLLFLAILGRIAFIGTDSVYSASASRNSVALTIDERRGMFYDCNMEALTYCEKEYVAILRPTEKVITSLGDLFSKEEIRSIMKRLQAGKPILQKVSAGTQSTEHIPVIPISSRYSSPQMLSHIIGVATEDEKNRSGLEKSYYDFLSINASRKMKYYVDAHGRMLEGDQGEIVATNYDSKRGVQLTINKTIQTLCEEAADKAEKFQKGSIVVLDVKTSEVLAMVSRPNIEPNNLSEHMDDENAPFINRSLSPYTVGSVFKLAVASEAIENGLSGFTHECTGSIQIGNTVFRCNKLDGHGSMDLQSAIGQSCNPYFIALGQQIGGTLLLNKVTDFGFGEETRLADGLISQAGTLPTMKQVNEKGNLANFSFGQGVLMATPLQVANMVACIANNGVYNTPTLVKALIDDAGNTSEETNNNHGKDIMDKETANLVQQYMIGAVENGSGRNAKPESGGAGGKTATAETGWLRDNGEEILHVWFAGFYPANAPQYAIVVMDEDGKSGATECCPIFKEIVDGIASQSLTLSK